MRRLAPLAALTALIFGIDLLIPMGVACGVLYVVVVLLSLGSEDGRIVVAAGLATTLLVLIKWAMFPSAGEAWKAGCNRLLSVFVIWSVAVVGLLYKRAAERLRRAEMKLAESEKQASLGRVAAVMAHQIRNPLAALVTAGATLAADGVDPRAVLELRRVLERESGRLSRFLEDFLRLTRVHATDLKESDLDRGLESVLESPRLESGAPPGDGDRPA